MMILYFTATKSVLKDGISDISIVTQCVANLAVKFVGSYRIPG